MCRLAVFPVNLISKGDILDILQDMEGVRTGHGFGYGFVREDQFISRKTSLPLSEILKKKSYKDFFGDCFNHDGLVMFHSRKASHGEVSYRNCHPFESKNYLFMHNGSFNECSLVEALLGDEIKYKSETDTEVCLHFLEKIGVKKFQLVVKDSGVFLAMEKTGNLNVF